MRVQTCVLLSLGATCLAVDDRAFHFFGIHAEKFTEGPLVGYPFRANQVHLRYPQLKEFSMTEIQEHGIKELERLRVPKLSLDEKVNNAGVIHHFYTRLGASIPHMDHFGLVMVQMAMLHGALPASATVHADTMSDRSTLRREQEQREKDIEDKTYDHRGSQPLHSQKQSQGLDDPSSSSSYSKPQRYPGKFGALKRMANFRDEQEASAPELPSHHHPQFFFGQGVDQPNGASHHSSGGGTGGADDYQHGNFFQNPKYPEIPLGQQQPYPHQQRDQPRYPQGLFGI